MHIDWLTVGFWFLLIFQSWGIFYGILMVGRPRKPYTGPELAFGVAVAFVCIVILWNLGIEAGVI